MRPGAADVARDRNGIERGAWGDVEGIVGYDGKLCRVHRSDVRPLAHGIPREFLDYAPLPMRSSCNAWRKFSVPCASDEGTFEGGILPGSLVD